MIISLNHARFLMDSLDLLDKRRDGAANPDVDEAYAQSPWSSVGSHTIKGVSTSAD